MSSFLRHVSFPECGKERVLPWTLQWTPFVRPMTMVSSTTQRGDQAHDSIIPSALSLPHACELLKSRQLSYSEVGTGRGIMTRSINSPCPSRNVTVST